MVKDYTDLRAVVSCSGDRFADNHRTSRIRTIDLYGCIGKTMSVILIGYRGSGKSSIGRRLADQLWLKFVDIDEMIVKQAGRTIREIFESNGEEHFRDLETAAVEKACKLADHVIAAGGGAVLREQNRKAMIDSGFKRIYLRCEPAVLLERINADPQTAQTRPALTSLAGSVTEIQNLLAVREPLYRSVMTGELEVTNLSVNDAATYITRLL